MNVLGLLFSDVSILILPEGTDVETARDEAEEHDLGANGRGTQVVRISVGARPSAAERPPDSGAAALTATLCGSSMLERDGGVDGGSRAGEPQSKQPAIWAASDRPARLTIRWQTLPLAGRIDCQMVLVQADVFNLASA
jgi:hypothetical protein